jgi:hypothetical protein
MKKIGAFLLSILLVTGCSCSNTKLTEDTPTKEVETYFSNYQTLSSDVLTQLDEVVNNEDDMTDEQKEEYKEIMKNHYKNLTYEIKDEVIDGDTATVTVEIEVTDYSKIMTDADVYLEEHADEFNNEEGIYDATLFTKYRLEKLKEASEKVKYTLDITLTKIEDDWVIDTLSDTDESKIQGMYIY